jgi:hypothetical protein
MNRKDEAIVLCLIENMKKHKNWCGETHIQKATFFLKELTDVPLTYNFILYKHGPYSFDLKEELNIMLSDLILQNIQKNPYGPSLYPFNNARQLSDDYNDTITSYSREICFISEKLSNKDVSELEQLATALYTIKNFSESDDSKAEFINKIKPHISIEIAKRAIDTVKNFIVEFNKYKQ